MLRFECDYGEGAAPAVLELLQKTNFDQTPGYGEDEYCAKAAAQIKRLCDAPDADVHFFVGATQANLTVIAAALKPWQGVLCADSGHIHVHETGSIEATGHKCLALPGKNGKITATTENNKVITVGYIALGKVENPAGLTHLDGPYYQALSGAGDLAVTTAGGAVSGCLNNQDGQDATDIRIVGSDNSLLSGFLEGSGTDLATEFSEMITTQRGYQANTRIVTVTDSMLEELVNMKR